MNVSALTRLLLRIETTRTSQQKARVNIFVTQHFVKKIEFPRREYVIHHEHMRKMNGGFFSNLLQFLYFPEIHLRVIFLLNDI